MAEFTAYGKTPRLNREMIVTEKIDGTNAGIHVEQFALGGHAGWGIPEGATLVLGAELGEDGLPIHEYLVTAQSRNRIITPGKSTDNYGFAGWVHEHAETLAELLGKGLHFGEWWGQGISHGYGMDRKVFSLFAVDRYDSLMMAEARSELGVNIDIVPVLARSTFSSEIIDDQVRYLRAYGSMAAENWDVEDQPAEGVIVFHTASREVYKVLCENDSIPKGAFA